MTLKTKMSLLLFLTSISIVSIGFSSWSITAETTAELNGNIQVDNVISSDKYIKLDKTKGENNTGINCFKYQEYGYLNEEGTAVTDTGYINTYFTMDLEKCNELFVGDYTSIKLEVKLHYSDDTNTTLNLFKINRASNGSSNITASCILDNQSISVITNNVIGSDSKVEYNSTFTFNNLLSFYENNKNIKTINFEIKYALFATTGDFFYNNIFQYLYRDMIELIDFEIEVMVSAV